jgi:hypothetical protein
MQPVTNGQIVAGLGAFAALMAGLSVLVWFVGAVLALAIS